MDIHFRITDLEAEESLVQSVQFFLTFCADAIGLDLQTVETIYIADDSNYSDAIHSVDPTASFTKDNELIGVGKAISRAEDSGEVVHSIVLRNWLVNAALSGSISGLPVDEWELPQQEGLYVICHELGHCIDNRDRRVLDFPKLRDGNEEFSIDRVARYFSQLLACEFSACVHSARIVQPALHALHISDFIEQMADTKHRLMQFKAKYDQGGLSLYEFAYQVSGGFWFILIQFAKLVGNAIGNDQNTIDQASFGPNADSQLEILHKLQTNLSNTWSHYPNWPSEVIIKEWTECWNALCLANGFLFVHGEDCDALYFLKQGDSRMELGFNS